MSWNVRLPMACRPVRCSVSMVQAVDAASVLAKIQSISRFRLPTKPSSDMDIFRINLLTLILLPWVWTWVAGGDRHAAVSRTTESDARRHRDNFFRRRRVYVHTAPEFRLVGQCLLSAARPVSE